VKMCQDCNTTVFIFAVFVVSLSLTHSVKCSVFYINYTHFIGQNKICILRTVALCNRLRGIFVIQCALTNNDNLYKLIRRVGRQTFLHMQSQLLKSASHTVWGVMIPRPNLPLDLTMP